MSNHIRIDSENNDTAQWSEIHELLQCVRDRLEGVGKDDPSPDAVLRARARLYARASEHSTNAEPAVTEDIVLFTLGGDTYGVACNDIEEVIPLHNLVALPQTGKGILGISSLRGVLFAVIDLKRILNLPASELTTMHRVLMLRRERLSVGFLVDSVQGMRSYNRADLRELPSEIHERSRAYMRGLVEGRILLLNAGMVLGDPLVTGERRIPVQQERNSQ
ncbi:MAG: purine-binding chemotaxis protein CheW [Bacteroidetes bacterium]|nr:purine-binding chemotaxis protein CheW [Bacteroidota bacterium]